MPESEPEPGGSGEEQREERGLHERGCQPEEGDRQDHTHARDAVMRGNAAELYRLAVAS